MELVKEFVEIMFQIFTAFFNIILRLIADLPISKMSLIKLMVDDSIVISAVPWINDTLLMIAGFIPPIVVSFLTSRLGRGVDGNVVFFLLLVVYALTIFLFQSVLFWIIVGVLFVILVLSLFFGDRMGFID